MPYTEWNKPVLHTYSGSFQLCNTCCTPAKCSRKRQPASSTALGRVRLEEVKCGLQRRCLLREQESTFWHSKPVSCCTLPHPSDSKNCFGVEAAGAIQSCMHAVVTSPETYFVASRATQARVLLAEDKTCSIITSVATHRVADTSQTQCRNFVLHTCYREHEKLFAKKAICAAVLLTTLR